MIIKRLYINKIEKEVTLKGLLQGASVSLGHCCLCSMKHCLAFLCEQQTIPYHSYNMTNFLNLFVLINATDVINNDYKRHQWFFPGTYHV